jgi:hypothetical protein
MTSYVEQQPKNYPSIVELKTKEKEILQLISDYKAEHDAIKQQYDSGICQDNPNANCGSNLTKSYKGLMTNLQNKNSVIIGKLNELKDMMAEVYPRGMENDSLVEITDKEQLVELSAQLNMENDKMTNLINELNTYDGENDVLVLNQQSHFMQYLVFMGLCIFLIYLTIKAYSTNSISNIENLILLVVIVLVVYLIWFKWSRGNLLKTGI